MRRSHRAPSARPILIALCCLLLPATALAADPPAGKDSGAQASEKSSGKKPAAQPAPAKQRAPRIVIIETKGKDDAKKGKAPVVKTVDPAASESETPSTGVPRPKDAAALRDSEKTSPEGSIVITNDTLEAIYGRSHPVQHDPDYDAFLKAHGQTAPSAARPAPAPKPAQDRTAELEQKLARLKRRLLSLQNPFVPRVTADKKEREAEQGMDNAQRAARVREQIRQIEQQLASKSGSRR